MLPEAWQVRVSPKGRLTGSPPLYSAGVARDYRAVARDRLSAEELPQVQIVPAISHNNELQVWIRTGYYRGGTSGVDRPKVTLASDIKELITQTDSIIDLGWVPG